MPRSLRPHAVSRRQAIRAGSLGLFGLSLPQLLAGRAVADETKEPSFGRAKACILLFMWGGPAHQDTWDLKPDAPSEIRGEFRPIPTSVAGIEISEHLPRLARQAHQYTLVRSVTHPDNTHTVAMHYMLTGVRHARPDTNPQNAADDFPCFGAAVNAVRLARCAGPAKYFKVVDEVFRSQPRWENGKIKAVFLEIGAANGVTEAQFNACLTDQKAQDALNARAQRASQVDGVNSTPTLFINGKQIDPLPQSPAEMDAAIAAALKTGGR